jgi:hypothetical protein
LPDLLASLNASKISMKVGSLIRDPGARSRRVLVFQPAVTVDDPESVLRFNNWLTSYSGGVTTGK